MPDVNVLVSGHRPETPLYERARPWLEGVLGEHRREQLGFSTAVLTGYVRVVTNHRIFTEPTPIDRALSDVELIMDADNAVAVSPGPGFWGVFAGLSRDVRARGGLISDVAHAATAIEAGATWVTFDRDFTRFPGLRCELL